MVERLVQARHMLRSGAVGGRSQRMLRSLLLCSSLILAAGGVTACGAAHGSRAGGPSGVSTRAEIASEGSSSASTPGAQLPDGDGDRDQPSSRQDPDNDKTLSFGHPAYAADRRALSSLVTRYYAVAAAGNGDEACSLLYWPTAESVVEEYEGSAGSPGLRGHTCALVASKLFARHRRELAAQVAALEVTEVRVSGNRGYVRLRFAATPEHLVAVHREGRGWKVNVLLDELGV